MEKTIGHLKPERVWQYFEEICQIPRPSKKEEKIAAYLVAFAKKHHLDYIQDKAGNVLIRKEASKGMENKPWVVLQSHMDMVCEKNSDVNFNFDTDAIVPRIDGQWVRATGTTLGADDGIGVALQLAILESDAIQHGPIECLFTVDEETGLTGAFALDRELLKSRILLNLDSEDEGELFIGCAGGKDTVATFDLIKDKPIANGKAFRIQVNGLTGGHSGDDINKGRGNANKVLNRILFGGHINHGLQLSNIDGGNLRNAIAREAFAEVVIPEPQINEFKKFFSLLAADIVNEQKTNEPDLKITLEPCNMPQWVMEVGLQEQLVYSLYACPHGVIAMSPDIPGLVETSTNLASIKIREDKIIVSTSQRSSVESSKEDICNMVANVFHLAGAAVKQGDGYPGWKPDVNSKVMNITRNAYKKLFGQEPKVLAIHAGLECGLIGEKYPGMDMISFGPTIKGAHSPVEGIQIDTVQKFYDLTLEVLKAIE
ncbi:MAG: aminoacyl-histidine dipeptidase [Bacteroidales bacterium]|nr:aminoacyl-histidine dipeptidase [Bacteroidales bacterium]